MAYKFITRIATGVTAVGLGAILAQAGSFTSDFSNPNQTGFTLNGGTRADGVTPYPAIANGRLELTYAEGSQQASIVLDDLDGGAEIESFTARFKLQIGPGSGNPADGVSFSFGPDINSSSNPSEEGAGNGLIVALDTYDNGNAEAPAIEIKYAGVSVAITKFAKADMVTSTFEDVEIQVARSGALNMSYKGQKLYENVILPGFAPSAGQFVIGARTGGENAAQWVDDLSITTVQVGNAVAPTITTQPQSQTINEGDPVTFAIGFDGSAPLSFEWSRNGAVITGATGPSYTIARVAAADNGAKYKCKVSNTAGNVTSSEATLTVNSDNVAPTLVSVAGTPSFNALTITFSEPLDPATAQTAANYQLSGGVTVSSPTLRAAPDDNIVTLQTSLQAEGASLVLTVNNVKDLAGNVIAANSTIPFLTSKFALGWASYERWHNENGDPGDINAFVTAIADGTIRPPDFTSAYQQFGGPWGARDNYASRVFGYFVPPSNGNYVFFLSSDDQSNLYLSTDDKPANKKLIAQEAGWSNQYQWQTIGGGSTIDAKRSDQFANTEWPDFWTITLQANRRYYIEILQDEGGGGDGSDATFIKAGEVDPAQTAAGMFLKGNVIATYLDPNGANVDITQQPADTTQQEGRAATFKVVATGVSSYGNTVSYQWQKAAPGSSTFTDIVGATGASYTTPLLALADTGSKYQVVCSVPTFSKASAAATLTVVPDTFGPLLVAASALASETGNTFDVGVTFDESVTAASAGTLANYTVSAGTISAVKYYAGSPGVVLTVAGLTVGNTYTVTVANVVDLVGNKMSTASKDFKVSPMKWGVVGAKELGLGNGVLAVAENGFDVYSDSIAEWGTYDEATFVYEEVTGDFDKVLRVEYQDSSSQWARAGLIARDVTNFGVDNATQTAGEAGRYQKVHVNPVVTAMGTAGNNSWEGNRRIATGAATTTAGGGGIPQYPNAWCRLQRAGDLFTIFRSDDGVTWTQLGTTTFTEPMPARLFVGPEFAPENGNLTVESGLRGVWLAKFRDYGNYSAVVQPTLSLSNAGGNMVLTYSGVLQSSATVNGTYAPVAGAVSPYTVTKTGSAQFYRTAGQ